MKHLRAWAREPEAMHEAGVMGPRHIATFGSRPSGVIKIAIGDACVTPAAANEDDLLARLPFSPYNPALADSTLHVRQYIRF